MSSDILLEEIEVLESIYPTELSKTSDRDLQIDVEPDDIVEGFDQVKLKLSVHYPDGYPDALPELDLDAVDGSLEDAECSALITSLTSVGEENLGMAMTFTLVSHLREQLSVLVRQRAELQAKEEKERERQALEADEARTRGTPVTVESFKAWKLKFDKEIAEKRARVDEERLKGLAPKEREEWKKIGTRPTGRQLFERNRNLEQDDENLMEEGTVSVDFSQYDRTAREDADDDEEDEERIQFSDSD